MANKIIRLDEYFPTGELTLQPALIWSGSKSLRHTTTKTACDANSFIDHNLAPIPGKSIILVIALGGWETYGLNRNADGFNEFPYKETAPPVCTCSKCQGARGWVTPTQTVVAHNNSFVEAAKVYKHHVNKNPEKSYGDVMKAFWNPEMHRSELLLAIDHAKAPDLAERLEAGEFFPVSMGCKIKYDVCTICGHRAPTRAQYCDHLKYSLRQVMPDGRQAGALNPAPKFFDISIVYRPADQTGWMLKKVAEEAASVPSIVLGDYVTAYKNKSANLRKLSDIDKAITGGMAGALQPAVEAAEELPDPIIAKLSELPIADSISALNALGVLLTAPEILRLILAKVMPGVPVPEDIAARLLAIQPKLLAVLEQHPQIACQCEELVTSPNPPVNKVAYILGGWRQKLATTGDYLMRAILPPESRYTEKPYTDILTFRDPATHKTYMTTRGAALLAKDQYAKRNIVRQAATTSLLSAAQLSKALGGSGDIPTELAAAVQPSEGQQVITSEGERIPQMTEVVEKTSAFEPIDILYSMARGYSRAEKCGAVDITPFLNEVTAQEKVGQFDSVEMPQMDLSRLIEALSISICP